MASWSSEPTIAAVDLAGSSRRFRERGGGTARRCAGEVGIVRPVTHGQLADLDLTAAVAKQLPAPRQGRFGEPANGTVLRLWHGDECPASGARPRLHASRADGFASWSFRSSVVLGSGLRIEEPIASMVVDVGAGTTEIGVLALGGLVTQASVPVGGGDFDEAIKNLCSRQLDLVIDSATAENVKYEIGSAWVEDDDKVEVRGRDASNGIVRSVVISRTEVADEHRPPGGPDPCRGGGVHLFSSTRSRQRLVEPSAFSSPAAVLSSPVSPSGARPPRGSRFTW